MQTAAVLQDKSKAKRPPPLDVGALASAGLRGFFGIAQNWGLAEKECLVLLGDPSRATYYNWKKGDIGKIGRDTLDRLSYIVGIYKALQILLPDDGVAHSWIRSPNDAPLFAGQPPLALMLTGQLVDLYRVRVYLDTQRGGWG
jgi:hypothetical protein